MLVMLTPFVSPILRNANDLISDCNKYQTFHLIINTDLDVILILVCD